MAVAVETLVVKLEAKVNDFERQMAKAQRTAATASNGIAARFATMNKAVTTAFRFAGISLGVDAFVRLAKAAGAAILEVNDMAKAADRIGLTTTALQELRVAGQQAGVEIAETDKALAKFSENIGKAAAGSGDLLAVLKANGVALRDSGGNIRPLNDLLNDYADLIKHAGSDQERLTLVTRAFGEGADNFVNVLRGGAAALQATRDEAEKTGLVLSKELVDKARELAPQWENLMQRFTVGFQGFVLSVVDGTAKAAGALTDMLTEIQKKGGIDLGFGIKFGAGTDPIQEAIDAAEKADAAAKGKSDADPLGLAKAKAHAELVQKLFEIQHAVPTTVVPGVDTAAAEAAAKKIADVESALKFEGEQLQRTARDQAIYNELNRAGVDISSAAGQAIAAQAGANFDLEASLKRTIERMDAFREISHDALSTFINDLREGKSAAEALGDVLQGLADKLLNAALDQLIASAFGPAGTAGGGLLSNLFGGGRQAGGPVTAGNAYRVGEHGPELFVPNVSGRIMSHGTTSNERHVVELLLSPEIDARIKRVSGPQAERISFNITRANNALTARSRELQG